MIYVALPFIAVAFVLGLLFTLLGAALILAGLALIGFVAYVTVRTAISKIRSLRERKTSKAT